MQAYRLTVDKFLDHAAKWFLAPTAATQMTEGVLSQESLRLLDPARVSPGLLALVGDDAPTPTILCAGAGNFARAERGVAGA